MNKFWWIKRSLRNQQTEGGEGGGGNSGLTVEQRLEELQTKFDQVDRERQVLLADKDRTLTEAKIAKQKADQASSLERKALEEKAREAGNFQELLKASEGKYGELESNHSKLQGKYSQEKQAEVARSVALKLTDLDNPHNADLLATLIRDRFRYDFDTGEVKILDEKGNETFMTLEQLTKEVDNNERFMSLLKSSKRSGGGANGSRGGASLNKQIARSDFDSLSIAARDEKVKTGWKVVD